MTNSITLFRAFNFIYYLYLAVFVAYTMPYLKHLGYSATMVGLFMSLIYLFGIIGQLITGYMCDLKSTIKYIYIACIVGLTASVCALFRVSSPVLLGLLLCLVGLFQSPSFSLLDCWVLESNTKTRNSYSSIRAFGSIGWGISTIVMGKLIDSLSYGIIPYIFTALSILVIILSLHTVDAQKTKCPDNKLSIKDIHILFSDIQYTHLILIFFLLYASFHSINMISIILLTQMSSKAIYIGVFTFIGSWSEIPILLYANKLLIKTDTKKLLVGSAFFFLFRAVLTYFAYTPIYIIILSLSQMFSFGIFIFISKYLVDEISPIHLKTSSQTIAMAFSSGISGIISSNATGVLIDKIGISNTTVIASLIAIAGLALSVLYFKMYRPNIE